MRGVLLSHEAAGERGEAGLHEEHEISGVQSPSKISGHSDVAHGVGELHRERLFGRLSLEFVGGLFALRIVRSVLVSRFGNDKGVTGGVNYGGFVTCSDARGIRLR